MPKTQPQSPTQPEHARRRQHRVEFVDALRGLAVFFMILWHTADGWLKEEVRSGAAWTAIRLMGGLAAPLFVFLAGVGAAMALGTLESPKRQQTANRILRRGLQIVALGYLLRLQFWAIDSLAILKPTSLAICILLFLGWLAILHTLGLSPYRWLPARLRSPSRWVGAVGLILVAVGYMGVHTYFGTRLRGVMRVDVLQCIGISVVAVSWLWRHRDRPALSFACAICIALLTHAMREAMPGELPPFVASYLAVWPSEEGPWTYFPLFPWMSYAFAGAATALAWKEREPRALSLLVQLAMAIVVGAAVYEGLPHVHQWMQATPEAVQPLRVLYRLAWIFGLSAIVQALFTFAPRLGFPNWMRCAGLLVIGRASLLIYWVHLEFAYGISARLVRKDLSIVQWLVGLSFVLLLSYIVAKIRTRKKFAKQTKLPSSKT